MCALLHSIFPKIEVVNTTHPFANYAGVRSNVYTALHWYSIDFGFIGACIIEFILGLIYGKLYKKVQINLRQSMMTLVQLSMLMFPLINQFFDDKMLSVFSMWVQRIFWIQLIVKSPVIQYTKKSHNNPT